MGHFEREDYWGNECYSPWRPPIYFGWDGDGQWFFRFGPWQFHWLPWNRP